MLANLPLLPGMSGLNLSVSHGMWFDGVNNLVSFTELSTLGDWSFSAAFFPTGGEYQTIIADHVGTNTRSRIGFTIGGEVLVTASDNVSYLSGQYVNMNERNTIAVSRSGNTLSISVNGAAAYTVSVTGKRFIFSAIGPKVTGFTAIEWFNGVIYNAVMTSAGADYFSYVGDGNANANWIDISTGGRNGTVAGSPTAAISLTGGASWSENP